MFNVGDLIIYSSHGICHIDDICEKNYSGELKKYYVLHPLNNENLQINAPVNNNSISILEIMTKEEAYELLNLFTLPGIDWIEKSQQRTQNYSDIAKTGNRKDIIKVVTTLMRKKDEFEQNGKKFPEFDRKLLLSIQNILFAELAIALNTNYDSIQDQVEKLLANH